MSERSTQCEKGKNCNRKKLGNFKKSAKFRISTKWKTGIKKLREQIIVIFKNGYRKASLTVFTNTNEIQKLCVPPVPSDHTLLQNFLKKKILKKV